jgi:hypothetical protein
MNEAINMRTILANKSNLLGFKLNINNSIITIVNHHDQWYSITKQSGVININPIIGLLHNINIKPLINLYMLLCYLNGYKLNIEADLKEETEKLYAKYYSEFII